MGVITIFYQLKFLTINDLRWISAVSAKTQIVNNVIKLNMRRCAPKELENSYDLILLAPNRTTLKYV